MADSTIGLPADGPGKKIDAESLTVAATTVHRERMQIAGAVDAEIARILNSDPSAGDYALVTREAGPIDPKSSTGSDANVLAGASGTVSSTQISSGKTAKLKAFEASSSVPFKVELQTVLDNVATTRLIRFGRRGDVVWLAPHKEFVTVVESAAAGFDGFRLVLTNLDTSQSADMYGTFFWDEV